MFVTLTTKLAMGVAIVTTSAPPAPGSWLVSDWDAGQSSALRWSPSNVRLGADGSIEFRLGPAPAGSPRPFLGAEVQSVSSASTGTWRWVAQAPRMVGGAVFAMFAYKADWADDPWLEFDFEFVGSDTRRVRLNIHMEDDRGRHVALEEAQGGPVIVDLGFDASHGLHSYAITVTETEAAFAVDGMIVGRFDAHDMPGGTWRTGELKGFVNLWALDASLASWVPDWRYDGTPLVARVAQIEMQDGAGRR